MAGHRMTAASAEVALRAATDIMPEGLAVFDAQLRLITSNARYAKILALPEALVSPGVALEAIALFLARRGDLGSGAVEVLAARRVQSLIGVTGSISRRADASGRVLEFRSMRMPDGGLTISFADVTAQVSAEAELEQMNLRLEERVAERTGALTRVNAELEIARAKADAANLDKTRFLAAASHDLLQPLNAARLYTSTLVERAGSSELGGLAHAIEASLNAVEEIMSALLDISRLDSGAMKQSPAPFRIDELLRKVEVELGPAAREKSIRLKLVGSAETVLADRMLVGRIVQNFVSNAIKYTRPGGRVLVGARRHGGRVRLDVIDTGIGISHEQRGLIFSEFSRLEQGARMAPGLGLGLSIVQRLVQALDLTQELDSVEGRGSRFSVYLPRTQARPLPVVEAAARTAIGIAGLNVLCVDNEKPILEAMSGLLTGWGINVRIARSLKEIARDRLLEGWLPDLVLMDYHLDQTSGLDAIEWLRHNVGGHLPAALLTADRTPQVRALAEERGIAVVTKPVKPAALRAVITSLAGGRGA